MKFILATLMFVLVVLPANSQEISLVGHGFSHHATNSSQYNQDNYGVGVRLQNSNLAVQFGTYRNSYDQTSNYLVLDLNLLSSSIADSVQLELGPMLAIVTGYPGYSVLAGPGMQAALRYNDFYIRARIMPALSTPAVVALELGYVLYRF